MIKHMIQELCMNLFLINSLVNYFIFQPEILYFQKSLIQIFQILKCDLLIKILNC